MVVVVLLTWGVVVVGVPTCGVVVVGVGTTGLVGVVVPICGVVVVVVPGILIGGENVVVETAVVAHIERVVPTGTV